MKKLISILTALVLIGLLAGCESGDDYYKSQLPSRDNDINSLKNEIADYRAKLAEYEVKYNTAYYGDTSISEIESKPRVMIAKQEPLAVIHQVDARLASPASISPTTPTPPALPKNESSVLLPALIGVAAGVAGKHMYHNHKTTVIEKYRRSGIKNKIVNLASKYRKRK